VRLALLTTARQSFSLTVNPRYRSRCSGEETAMDNEVAWLWRGDRQIPIADLRDVPLGELAADADWREDMVRMTLRGQEGMSRVGVAAFQSAI
jgi:hypothetical protein